MRGLLLARLVALGVPAFAEIAFDGVRGRLLAVFAAIRLSGLGVAFTRSVLATLFFISHNLRYLRVYTPAYAQ